jgi:hypothetical protein
MHRLNIQTVRTVKIVVRRRNTVVIECNNAIVFQCLELHILYITFIISSSFTPFMCIYTHTRTRTYAHCIYILDNLMVPFIFCSH